MIKKVVVFLGLTLFLGFAGMLSAQDDVMFNYQGRVKVQGNPFSGSGQFKFAIINNAGNESLWSNDNTSVGGGEPISSHSISVTDGVFNAMIGDTSLGMSSINRSILNHPNRIKLRIWFSDGAHGFQQLLPDHKLVNLEILGHTTGTADFTIYVNGATGNDEHNGLSSSKAKKTIQAAVDLLPERLKCNVTIDIADGVYREEVKVFGIRVEPQKTLTFMGDESWTPSSPGDPSVRITGSDDDITSPRIRDYCIMIQGCYNALVKGILFDYADVDGILLEDGSYTLEYCEVANNDRGMTAYNSVWGFVKNSIFHHNDKSGIHLTRRSELNFENVECTYNGDCGLLITSLSNAGFTGTGKFSNNGTDSSAWARSGIAALYNCMPYFAMTLYSGEIKNNSKYGLYLMSESFSHNHTLNTITGNGTAQVQLENNSHTY